MQDVVADGKAKPYPARVNILILLVQLPKHLKELALVFLLDPDACVLDCEFYLAVLLQA